jgi:hypothetical protein
MKTRFNKLDSDAFCNISCLQRQFACQGTKVMRQTFPIAAMVSMIALATPASATLEFYIDVSGMVLTCSDNAPCDKDPAIGVLETSPTTINGVLFEGERMAATTGPNFLSSSVLAAINTTNVAQTVKVIASDTDFVGPASHDAASSSSTWQNAIGSAKENSWFIDSANAQGAGLTGATPGTNVDNSFLTVTEPAQSFSSGPFLGPLDITGPFSMTIESQYTLTPFGELLNRGMQITATSTPEPSTWAMLGIGFAAIGYLASRRDKARMAASEV